jgi:hypothetical protein
LGEFLVDALGGFAAEGGAVREFLGDEVEGAGECFAPRVGRRVRRGGVRGAGRWRAGGEAGFQRDGLADDAGEAGEEDGGVGGAAWLARLCSRSRRWCRGCFGLRRLNLGRLSLGRFGLQVLQGALGGGLGELHAEFGELAAHAQVARGAFLWGFFVRVGRDGVQDWYPGLEHNKNMEAGI